MILMSNNQWKCDKNRPAWKKLGEDCSASARVPGLVRAYLEVMPDVLALQEVSSLQAEIMMGLMKSVPLENGGEANYEYVSGGDTPMVYRKDRLKLIESGFLRYPEEIPGIEGNFNNYGTKSYTWCTFESREDKKRFAVMSTHLWWKSDDPASPNYLKGSGDARAWQIKLAADAMDGVAEKYGCPAFITGDLNDKTGSRCLETLLGLGWREARDLASGDRDETSGYHPCGVNGYSRPDDRGTFDDAIDHILLKRPDLVTVGYFRRFSPTWFDKLSDHYPVYIDFDFK